MVLYSLTYGAFLHVGTEGFANNIILNGWKYFGNYFHVYSEM